MRFAEACKAYMRRKKFSFKGRASRSEFWWFYLLSWIATAGIYAILIIASIFIASFQRTAPGIENPVVILATFIFLAGIIVIYIFQLAVMARRLHDLNLSGWLQLITLLPFGSLTLLIIAMQKGIEGINRYGPDPLICPKMILHDHHAAPPFP